MYSPDKAGEVMQDYIASEKEEEKSGGYYGYSILHMSDVRAKTGGHTQGERTDEAVRAQMRRCIRENGDKEMLVHSSCLGTGLMYCGSQDQGLTEELLRCIQVGGCEWE